MLRPYIKLMNKKYHFWITGCQMNYADARQVATSLEKQGYRATPNLNEANVVVLQTCTVRQQSEDKAYNKLRSLYANKRDNADLTLAVMGCVVGVRGNEELSAEFPYVDVFMEPATDGSPLVAHLLRGEDAQLDSEELEKLHALQNEAVILPPEQRGELVSAPVSIVYGCSHACTFCIIPQKRGKERSRAVGDIVSEVRGLVQHGVQEVVLLGQIVDRYGYDIEDGPDLADLLRAVSGVEGLQRIRFLTGHPIYMSERILQAVADLPKVMPQIEIPIQAGDDEVLENMKRGYTQQQYRELVARVHKIVPDASIHCDVIVGFPGETDTQFEETYKVLHDLELDKVHLARYSPRKGTVSARRMPDDVPDEVKRARFARIEALQKEIQSRKNLDYMGQVTEVLVENMHKGRWRGRNPQGRLVFFDDPRALKGKLVEVKITHTGPYSLSGTAIDKPEEAVFEATDSIPLALI